MHRIRDFKTLVEQSLYIDKTEFIETLFSAQRLCRIYQQPPSSKSVLLSMLYYFFNADPLTLRLFNNLKISRNYNVMQHQGKYPALHLDFETLCAGVESFADFHEKFQSKIAEFATKNDCQLIIEYSVLDSLRNLISMVHHKKRRCIILMDSPDKLLHIGYCYGFYEQAKYFLNSLLEITKSQARDIDRAIIFCGLFPTGCGPQPNFNHFKLYSYLEDENHKSYFFFNRQEFNEWQKKFEMSKEEQSDMRPIFKSPQYYNPKHITNYHAYIEPRVPMFTEHEIYLRQKLSSRLPVIQSSENMKYILPQFKLNPFGIYYDDLASLQPAEDYLLGLIMLGNLELENGQDGLPIVKEPEYLVHQAVLERGNINVKLTILYPCLADSLYTWSEQEEKDCDELYKGVGAYNNGHYESAILSFSTIESTIFRGVALNNKAVALFEMGLDPRATLSKALKLLPHSQYILNNIGVYYLSLKQLYIARFYFEKSLQTKPLVASKAPIEYAQEMLGNIAQLLSRASLQNESTLFNYKKSGLEPVKTKKNEASKNCQLSK